MESGGELPLAVCLLVSMQQYPVVIRFRAGFKIDRFKLIFQQEKEKTTETPFNRAAAILGRYLLPYRRDGTIHRSILSEPLYSNLRGHTPRINT